MKDVFEVNEKNAALESYKTKLLNQVETAIDEVLAHFLREMPESYFESNDEETIQQHLSALVTAHTSGNQERIALVNHDASQQTFIQFGSYSGLLSDILEQLPVDRSIQLARAYTTHDNSLVIDIFDYNDARTTSQNSVDRAEKTRQISTYLSQQSPAEAPAHNHAQISEFINAANEHYLKQFECRDVAAHFQLVNRVRGSLDSATHMSFVPHSDGLYYIAYAAGQVNSTDLFKRLCRYFSRFNCDIREAFLENFTPDTPTQTALVVLQIQLNNIGNSQQSEEVVRSFITGMTRLPYLDKSVLDLSFSRSDWPLDHAEVLIGLCHLAHQIIASDKKALLSKESIKESALSDPTLARAICKAFLLKFSPNGQADSDALIEQTKQSIVDKVADNNDSAILSLLIDIVEATLKSNVHCKKRYALAFRLSPELFVSAARPQQAFGVFFVHGKAFDGFHVRFQDIARGGVRIVQPSGIEQYGVELSRLFDEVYGLAYAQQLKNKDIPEGGSKGVILVKPGAHTMRCGKSFINSLLDLILDNENLDTPRIDYYSAPELLFLGPDENVTNDLIDWVIERATQRHYTLPGAFMSSKPNAGINHKQYGVTSEGVTVFLEVGLLNLGINPRQQPFTIKITGGPDGDVAGNEIKILHREYGENAKILGIADGSGCAEDPAGLDHAELLRLVEQNQPIAAFDRSALSPEGRVLNITDPGGAEARNTLHNRLSTDVFVPAGGRPATLNAQNCDDFLFPDGRPSSRLIVEGANLFLTAEARESLAQHGVLIVKDSSANKCGVICSSYEIIASMMLSEAEFLAIKDDFVAEVISSLREFAMFEAKTLFREHYFRPELSLTQLSMALSAQIIKITDLIAQLLNNGEIEKQGFAEDLLLDFMPPSLRKKMGPSLVSTLPPAYVVRAIASVLASKIIYHEGIAYLTSLNDEQIADHVVKYLKEEEQTSALIRELEHWDVAAKSRVIELLKRGATGTALRWGI